MKRNDKHASQSAFEGLLTDIGVEAILNGVANHLETKKTTG